MKTECCGLDSVTVSNSMKLWAVQFKADGEHKGKIYSDHEVIVESDTDTLAVRIALDRFTRSNPFATVPLVKGTPKAVELESIYIYNNDLYRIVERTEKRRSIMEKIR
jgi:hypothetical protein